MHRQFLFILLVAVYVLQCDAAKGVHHKAAKVPAENAKVNKEENELERNLDEDADDEENLFEDDDDVVEKMDDAVFVDDDILNNLERCKRPRSRNRKCRRFYKGHWQAPPCDADENQVGVRNHGTEVCCSPCIETAWCANRGGSCTYSWKCKTSYNRRGCGGKCGCCY